LFSFEVQNSEKEVLMHQKKGGTKQGLNERKSHTLFVLCAHETAKAAEWRAMMG
jgi:hypothetical protein